LQHEKSPCCSETVQRPSGIDQRAFFRRSSATFFFFNWHAACFKGSRVCSGGLFESPPGVPDFQWDRLAPIPLLLNSLLTQGPRSGCFYGSSEGLKESSSKLTSIASSQTNASDRFPQSISATTLAPCRQCLSSSGTRQRMVVSAPSSGSISTDRAISIMLDWYRRFGLDFKKKFTDSSASTLPIWSHT